MWLTVLWVSLVVTVVAFVADAVMHSFVFNKGMEQFIGVQPGEPINMASFLGRQLINTLVFGLVFTFFYAIVRGALPGAMGGLGFGLLLWAPSYLHDNLSTMIWYAKVKPVAVGSIWSGLVKCLACGLAVGLLIG